jgi:hypothetical protein
MKIGAAIVKVEPKVGSTLPVFSAPPIDAVVLSNLNDNELLSVAKHACSIYTQAGAYAKEFLAELKRRFDEGKKLRKPYLGFKNFDKLCKDQLEIGARQVRNILNNNRGGRKGRALKPRPKLKELEDVKAENKRLKAHAKLVEDANDRIAGGQKQLPAGYTKLDLEQAKKDAARDHQKIAASEKQRSENEIEALKDAVRKLARENRKLQKDPQQSRHTPERTKSSSRPVMSDTETPTKKEPVANGTYKLATHKAPTGDDSRYHKAIRELEELGEFGIASWHEFEIEHALEVRNIDASAENVAAILGHPRISEMEERMKAAGWDLIWTIIDELRLEAAVKDK